MTKDQLVATLNEMQEQASLTAEKVGVPESEVAVNNGGNLTTHVTVNLEAQPRRAS